MRNDQLAKELKRNYTASFCPLPWNIAIWPLAHFGPCWLNILRMLLSFCRIDYCHLVLWMLLQAEYCRIMCKTQPKWYNYSVDLVKIWDTHTHTVTLCHFYLSIFSWRWKTFGPRHNLPIDHVLLFTSRPQPWLKIPQKDWQGTLLHCVTHRLSFDPFILPLRVQHWFSSCSSKDWFTSHALMVSFWLVSHATLTPVSA